VTKISQLSSIGDSLAIGDQFLIRDIDDTGSPNKSVTISGMTRALDTGTALAPALAFASDKNTGIYSPGADQVAISTNGTEKLIVKSDGKVGLGTSAPSSLLHLVSSGQPTITVADADGRTLLIQAPSSTNSAFIGTTTNHDLLLQAGTTAGGLNVMRFNTAGAERVRITDTGRVGIGTTSPSSPLTVGPDAGAGTQTLLTLINANTTYATGLGPSVAFQVGTGTSLGSLSYLMAGSSFSDGSRVNISNRAGGSGYFDLVVNGSERLRVDSSGRLLVGTSSDSGGALLQVNDNRIRIATANTPASAGATGTTGEIAWDADYIYVCTATNTWKRTAIATW
jgi:hypothetical protein